MAKTDSVSLFAEGTFEEQIQELVAYIVRNRSEEETSAITRPIQGAFKQAGQKPLEKDEPRRKAIFSSILPEIKGLGDGSDREIEGFFNLLFAHLFNLFSVDAEETQKHLTSLVQAISSSPSENSGIKYRILSNLFNAIPRRSPLRLLIYKAVVRIATANDELDLLKLSVPRVEAWVTEWAVPPEEKSEFWKIIMDAFAKTGSLDTCLKYQLGYIRSLPAPSPASRAAAVDAIAATLRLPSVFEFDSLIKLNAVADAKDHELYSLLRVFMNGSLDQFASWEETHPAALAKYDLDRAQLTRKIRLLALASLGFKHVGQDVPYSKIATALQIKQSEVESWVIDIIRTGLLSGKLSQANQTLHVTRSTACTFEREHWEGLEKKLEAWKNGLAGVLEFLTTARKSRGNGAAFTRSSAQPQAPTAAAA